MVQIHVSNQGYSGLPHIPTLHAAPSQSQGQYIARRLLIHLFARLYLSESGENYCDHDALRSQFEDM